MVDVRILKGFSRYLILSNGVVEYRKTGKVCPDYSDGNKKGKNGKCRGYRKIKIYDDKGVRKCFSVHRLVWLAFFGEIPKGFEVDHIDGKRSNNSIDNLRVIPILINRKRKKGKIAA